MMNKKFVCIVGLVLLWSIDILGVSPDFQDQQKLSFEDRITFFYQEFAQIPVADEFKIEILGLLSDVYTYQELLYLVKMTKGLAQEKNDSLRMEYFYEALLLNRYNGEKAFIGNRSYQEKLHTAYHEAGHAVALIMNESVLSALCYVTIEQRSSSLGHCEKVPLVIDPSSDDDIKIEIEKDIQVLFGGGIGEQLFNMSADDRIFNIDNVDRNDETYNFLDCISRKSALNDIYHTYELANMLASSQHNFAEGYIPTDQEKAQILFEFYEKTRAELSFHKDKIENLALLLMQKETVFADEAYKICGKERPKFYFEK